MARSALAPRAVFSRQPGILSSSGSPVDAARPGRAVLFNSAVFVFFYLPVVLVGYLATLRMRWARAGIAWLGLASIFFYGYWNPAFLPLLAASSRPGRASCAPNDERI